MNNKFASFGQYTLKSITLCEQANTYPIFFQELILFLTNFRSISCSLSFCYIHLILLSLRSSLSKPFFLCLYSSLKFVKEDPPPSHIAKGPLKTHMTRISLSPRPFSCSLYFPGLRFSAEISGRKVLNFVILNHIMISLAIPHKSFTLIGLFSHFGAQRGPDFLFFSRITRFPSRQIC